MRRIQGHGAGRPSKGERVVYTFTLPPELGDLVAQDVLGHDAVSPRGNRVRAARSDVVANHVARFLGQPPVVQLVPREERLLDGTQSAERTQSTPSSASERVFHVGHTVRLPVALSRLLRQEADTYTDEPPYSHFIGHIVAAGYGRADLVPIGPKVTAEQAALLDLAPAHRLAG